MLSPKTQMLAQGPGGDPETAFKQQFAQLAQDTFAQKSPAFMNHVVDFQVVSVNMAEETGVGAMRLRSGGNEVHVPIIVSGGTILPITTMYSVAHKRYLPFNAQWFEAIGNTAPATLGSAERPPKNMNTDHDIRHLVLPPQTGRFAYASTQELSVLDCLYHASNDSKDKFIGMLSKQASLRRYVFRRFSEADIKRALTHRKTAQAGSTRPILEVFNASCDFNKIASLFKERAPLALAQIDRTGFAIYDQRKQANVAVVEDTFARYTSSAEPGIHYLIKHDGSRELALCIPNPTLLAGGENYRNSAGSGKARNQTRPDLYQEQDSVILSETGMRFLAKYSIPMGVVQNSELLDDTTYTRLFKGAVPSTSIAQSQRGIFIGGNNRLHGTGPIQLWRVWNSGGLVHFEGNDCTSGQRFSGVIDTSGQHKRIRVFSGGAYDKNSVLIPSTFKWLQFPDIESEAASTNTPAEYVQTVTQLAAANDCMVKSTGAIKFSAVQTEPGFYIVNSKFCTVAEAAATLCKEANLTEQSCRRVLKMAEYKKINGWGIPPLGLHKLANAQVPVAEDGMTMQQPGFEEDSAAMQEQQMLLAQEQQMLMGQQALSAMNTAMMDMSSLLSAQRDEVLRAFEKDQAVLAAQEDMLNNVGMRMQSLMSGAPPATYEDLRSMARANPHLSTFSTPEPQMAISEEPMTPLPEEVPQQAAELAAEAPPEAVPPSVADAAFDASAIGALIEDTNVVNFAQEHSTQFQDTLDLLTRTLLEVQIKEPLLRAKLGDARYEEITSKLIAQVKALGDITLALHQNSLILSDV